MSRIIINIISLMLILPLTASWIRDIFKMEAKMEPFKGAIVNYHCIKGEEYLGCGEDMILPAIITKVLEGTMKGVNLVIFTNQPSSLIVMRTSVAYGMTNGGGWTWPAGLDTHNKDTVEAPVSSQPVLSTGVKPQLPIAKVAAPKVG